MALGKAGDPTPLAAVPDVGVVRHSCERRGTAAGADVALVEFGEVPPNANPFDGLIL